MPGHEDLAVVEALDHGEPRLPRLGEDVELGNLAHVLGADFGMARVRGVEDVVEAAEEVAGRLEHVVLEDAEALARQVVLGNAVEVVERGLGGPADVERGEDVARRGVVHDLQQLRPVVHVLEGEVLHGGAGHDHAVEMPVLDFVEGLVEAVQVVQRRVLGHVLGRAQERDVDLDGGVAEHAEQLGLRGDFRRHEVHDDDVERAYVLRGGALFGHHEDVFLLQSRSGRKIGGDVDGHGGL